MRFSSSIVAAATITSSVFAKTIPVQVGANGLSFTPNSTTAATGDILEFSFYPKMHNVAQGSFNSPCGSGDIKEPIFSGNMQVASGKGQMTFSVKVNNTDPLWMYCSVAQHCQQGMAMVVNPPANNGSSQTLEAYKSAAAKTGNSITPTQERGGVLSQNATGTGANATRPTGTPRATSTRNAASENSGMGWGMWSALAGAAAFGAVAL